MPTQREAYDFYKKHKSATFKLKAPSGMNTAELNSAISKLVDKKDTPASVRKEWQKLSLKSDAGIGDIQKNIKAVKKEILKKGGATPPGRPKKQKPKPNEAPKTKKKMRSSDYPDEIILEGVLGRDKVAEIVTQAPVEDKLPKNITISLNRKYDSKKGKYVSEKKQIPSSILMFDGGQNVNPSQTGLAFPVYYNVYEISEENAEKYGIDF